MTNPATDADVERVVTAPAGLVPPFAVAVLAPLGGQTTTPYEEERAAASRASSRRRAELLGGRACAHAAVRALGQTDGPIGVGPGREPMWPPGVVGSIAHGGSWCGAVVARAGDALGIGFDIEPLAPLPPEVERLVLTDEELTRLPSSGPLGRCAGTIVFSAKECVYKCLFPITRSALELQDVSVELHLDTLRYRARLSDRHLRQRGLETLNGEFRVQDHHLFTALCLPAGPGCVAPEHR